jgi:hypothetical protein
MTLMADPTALPHPAVTSDPRTGRDVTGECDGADSIAAPRFTPEHYGCPPWCTQNVRIEGENFVGHDSADGMPEKPGFRGYRHTTTRLIPYASAWENASAWELRFGRANPMSVNLDLEPGAAEPRIALGDADDNWTEFTLPEAGQLAAEIRRMVAAYGRPRCPSWCEDGHRVPADIDGHYAMTGVFYAASPKDEDGIARGVYDVALFQSAPEISLCGGVGASCDEIKLTLREARQVAEAIIELVGAAREGCAVSSAFADPS